MSSSRSSWWWIANVVIAGLWLVVALMYWWPLDRAADAAPAPDDQTRHVVTTLDRGWDLANKVAKANTDVEIRVAQHDLDIELVYGELEKLLLRLDAVQNECDWHARDSGSHDRVGDR